LQTLKWFFCAISALLKCSFTGVNFGLERLDLATKTLILKRLFVLNDFLIISALLKCSFTGVNFGLERLDLATKTLILNIQKAVQKNRFFYV
jgi:hypothetical protein